MKASQTGQPTQATQSPTESSSSAQQSTSPPVRQSLPALVLSDPVELALTTEEWKSIGRKSNSSQAAAASPSTSDPSRLLDGIGFISNTGTEAPSTPKSQVSHFIL